MCNDIFTVPDVTCKLTKLFVEVMADGMRFICTMKLRDYLECDDLGSGTPQGTTNNAVSNTA